MTKGLRRYYGTKHLHFIICSCYRRRDYLNTGKRRDLFLRILEEARRKYPLVVHGYVLMPEHFRLLITEPELGDPSVVMKVVKQRFARRFNRKRRRPRGGAAGAVGCSSGSSLAEALLRFPIASRPSALLPAFAFRL